MCPAHDSTSACSIAPPRVPGVALRGTARCSFTRRSSYTHTPVRNVRTSGVRPNPLARERVEYTLNHHRPAIVGSLPGPVRTVGVDYEHERSGSKEGSDRRFDGGLTVLRDDVTGKRWTARLGRGAVQGCARVIEGIG